MKGYVKAVVVFLFVASLALQAGAQGTKKAPTPPQPPPLPKEMKVVVIDTATEEPPPRMELIDDFTLPPISFDTTASPDDAFTHDILRLLEVTNAIKIGTSMADNMQEMAQANDEMKEFYSRFMEDMRTGTMRRWMERIYTREYRKRFSHADIQELLRFYDSPVGKKIVDQTVDLLPGVMQQGRKMGEYMGMKIYMEMLNGKKGN